MDIFPTLQKIIDKYQLTPATQRNLPLLTLSCIGYGYTVQMRASFGISVRAVGGLGNAGGFQSLLNEAAIASATGRLIHTHADNIDRALLRPLQRYANEVVKRMKRLVALARQYPDQFLRELPRVYTDYMAAIGMYNNFWRYIGDGRNVKVLTPAQVKKISAGRDAVAKLYPAFEKTLETAVVAVGKQYGFDGDLLRYLTLRELQALSTFQLNAATKVLLRARRKQYFYLYEERGDNECVVTDSAIIKRIQKKYYAVQDNIQSVNGSPAFRGQVIGTVLNMVGKKMAEIKRLPADCVLIAAMTHPDDLPLLKKVKAIVTDEGGIICHAAIVARELKIPTVVGTKIATKVFTDGDGVEVDAVKGMVRKIK